MKKYWTTIKVHSQDEMDMFNVITGWVYRATDVDRVMAVNKELCDARRLILKGNIVELCGQIDNLMKVLKEGLRDNWKHKWEDDYWKEVAELVRNYENDKQ